MTKTQLKKATKTVYTILKQIAKWIPRDIVKDAAERHGIRYRTFDPWIHLVTLLVVQLSHEESLLVVRRESTSGWGRREAFVLQAVERIRREACDGLTAHDVIAAAPVSRSLFILRFREAVGHSVQDEIEHVRMERVFTLLRDTKTPISAVAALCGWRSDIALRWLFHRRTGMSMRQWRRENT